MKQFDYSLLTSTRPFYPKNCYSHDVFSFSDHSLTTLEIAMWENPSTSAVSEMQARPSGTSKHGTFKVTEITLLEHSAAQFEFQQAALTMSACHVIG